ncbi:MAG: DUF1150 family protein [Pseudomonadota bacterium]
MSDTREERETGRPIVYIREAPHATLPDELKTAPQPIYAVHDEQGNVLALAPNRPLAFAMAKRNDLVPFSVH